MIHSQQQLHGKASREEVVTGLTTVKQAQPPAGLGCRCSDQAVTASEIKSKVVAVHRSEMTALAPGFNCSHLDTQASVVLMQQAKLPLSYQALFSSVGEC